MCSGHAEAEALDDISPASAHMCTQHTASGRSTAASVLEMLESMLPRPVGLFYASLLEGVEVEVAGDAGVVLGHEAGNRSSQ